MKKFKELNKLELQKLVSDSKTLINVKGALIELKNRGEFKISDDYLQGLVQNFRLNNVDTLFEKNENYEFVEFYFEDKFEKSYIPIIKYAGIIVSVISGILMLINNLNIYGLFVGLIGVFVTLFTTNLLFLLTNILRQLRHLNQK